MADAPAAHKPVILVIDDERSIRLALRRFFERRGWEYLEAEDGRQAVDILLGANPRPIDVIICDIKMPGITGMDLYYRLERERPELVRRLLVSTGDVTSPDVANFLQHARAQVLEKPFELPTLGKVVEEIRRTQGGSNFA